MTGEAGALDGASFTHREILGIISGILLGMLLAALDQTVVTTALPVIAEDLNGLQHLSWIITAYLLTSTASTPIYGKLSDLYGRRKLLELAIALFAVSSALCALSQTMGELIAARALQGLGGGGLISMAQAVIADVISPRERGRYQAYFSGVWAVASVAGPVVGGLFVEYLSWRWVFWINLPIGAAAFLLCHRALRRLLARRVSRRIDYLGAALLTPAVTALLLVAAWGGTELPWESTVILVLLFGGLALLGVFVLQELRAPEPLLPPRLFINPVIRIANVVSFIVSMAMFAAILLLPVFLQLVSGVSAGNSGLLLAPFMAGTVVGSYAAGQIMRHIGRYKRPTLAVLPLSLIAFGLLATMDETTPALVSALYMGLLGIGIGAAMPTMMVATQNAAEARDIGAATASVAFFRSLGGSFGAAILWAILLCVLSERLAAAGMTDTGLAAKLLRGGAAPVASAQQTLVAALAYAFRITFAIGGGIIAAAVVALLFLKDMPLRTAAAGARPLSGDELIG